MTRNDNNLSIYWQKCHNWRLQSRGEEIWKHTNFKIAAAELIVPTEAVKQPGAPLGAGYGLADDAPVRDRECLGGPLGVPLRGDGGRRHLGHGELGALRLHRGHRRGGRLLASAVEVLEERIGLLQLSHVDRRRRVGRIKEGTQTLLISIVCFLLRQK